MDAQRFQSTLELLPKLKMGHITVPPHIVQNLGGVGTRLLCSINEHSPFHCGMVAKGGGAAYISINKARRKKWHLQLGDDVRVVLELDPSKYGLKMPEELEALLDQDEEGVQLFESLTDGQKRYIIYYVSQVKSSQLRIDRAILLINNLKTLPGSRFDFRHLLGLPPNKE